MGVAGLLGLVPDGHAVVLQLEVALLLPSARLDFPHYRPNQHGLEVVIHLDAWENSQFTLIFKLAHERGFGSYHSHTWVILICYSVKQPAFTPVRNWPV